MNKSEKLRHIILTKYSSIREFSKIVEIPSTTLTSALDKGIGGMAVDRIIKICSVLNIDIKTFEPLTDDTYQTNHLSKEETTLLDNYNKLNDLGKKEANKRVCELTEISRYRTDSNPIDNNKPEKRKFEWDEPGKEHLMPIASHNKKGNFTEEDYKHDDDIMDDDDFWK